MKCDKKDLLLYAVTDRRWLGGRRLADQVEEALKGGVTFVQLREKDLDEERFLPVDGEVAYCDIFRVFDEYRCHYTMEYEFSPVPVYFHVLHVFQHECEILVPVVVISDFMIPAFGVSPVEMIFASAEYDSDISFRMAVENILDHRCIVAAIFRCDIIDINGHGGMPAYRGVQKKHAG